MGSTQKQGQRFENWSKRLEKINLGSVEPKWLWANNYQSLKDNPPSIIQQSIVLEEDSLVVTNGSWISSEFKNKIHIEFSAECHRSHDEDRKFSKGQSEQRIAINLPNVRSPQTQQKESTFMPNIQSPQTQQKEMTLEGTQQNESTPDPPSHQGNQHSQSQEDIIGT
ncbi:hydroxyproline-rich glycoprotein family protein [Striga asiatica]|uniref:Hydroxyproline-rich glycoprotein family protein n=1 Tax=Striga asiatica TaxID=4170 RepID=A0A5A7RKV1_STRAF|nr:hydroxyproline-rich glycoprotein family protein [Striga asiatica]